MNNKWRKWGRDANLRKQVVYTSKNVRKNSPLLRSNVCRLVGGTRGLIRAKTPFERRRFEFHEIHKFRVPISGWLRPFSFALRESEELRLLIRVSAWTVQLKFRATRSLDPTKNRINIISYILVIEHHIIRTTSCKLSVFLSQKFKWIRNRRNFTDTQFIQNLRNKISIVTNWWMRGLFDVVKIATILFVPAPLVQQNICYTP